MPDGSMLVSSRNSILKADLSDSISTFIEDSNQTNAMGWDQRGRLISVQRARGNEKVGVLYPPDQVTTLADGFQGQPFNSLNDLALDARASDQPFGEPVDVVEGEQGPRNGRNNLLNDTSFFDEIFGDTSQLYLNQLDVSENDFRGRSPRMTTSYWNN